jgi:RTX calcium-binding nonapeptide repeat (4 copies)
MRLLAAATATTALLLATCAAAPASTSHAGWPEIDGVLKMHKNDESSTIDGTPRSDELLGGHGDDTLNGAGAADVLWGDYKPSGQPASQWDHLNGGAGNDFIYASHGRNTIDAGPGKDYVKAHYGRGAIDCGDGADVLYISHRARKGYKISNCETISYKSLGF